MATYAYTKTTKTNELYDALVAALGAHFTTVQGSGTINGATSTAGTVVYDGVPTTGQIQAVIDAYVLPILGTSIDLLLHRVTSNATPITVTYTPPTSSSARLEAIITASDGASVKVFDVWIQVKRGAGNAILVGTAQAPVATQGDAGASTWTAAGSVSGTNVVLTLTGENAKTINWLIEITGRVFNP